MFTLFFILILISLSENHVIFQEKQNKANKQTKNSKSVKVSSSNINLSIFLSRLSAETLATHFFSFFSWSLGFKVLKEQNLET
jgi:hypothetical protein